MSESHLPDNCRDWPADPYGLLGVSVDDDMKAVKRAYTKLIKLYKPEHYPKEFQLLRSAFDSIQEGFDFRQRYKSDISESSFVDSVTIESPDPSNEPSEVPSREPDQIWETAVQGISLARWKGFERPILRQRRTPAISNWTIGSPNSPTLLPTALKPNED